MAGTPARPAGKQAALSGLPSHLQFRAAPWRATHWNQRNSADLGLLKASLPVSRQRGVFLCAGRWVAAFPLVVGSRLSVLRERG